MTTVIGTRRFSVEEYHRMAEVGILKPDDRVELLDGDIIPMAPMSSRHAAAISKIAEWLQRAFAGRAMVRVQSPIRLDGFSEPEPDIALVRVDTSHYAEAHPRPADVLLLIEVAQSSLAYDRDVKIPQYARAGIAETWLVNLELQQVELFRVPGPLGYAETTVNRRGATAAPKAFPQASVNVDDLLA
jgi:Uma2 family endonuclease